MTWHVGEEWSQTLTTAARSRPRQRDQPERPMEVLFAAHSSTGG